MNQNQKYAIHLDNLRRKSKITVNNLCDGIVNPRTYRRYLTGEKTLTHLKVVDFCQKLGISVIDFYYSASEQDIFEFQSINNLYKLIQLRDFNKFIQEAKHIKRERIVEKQNKRFYDFCILKVEFELHKKRDDLIIHEMSALCGYPNCNNRKAFDFVDLVSLQLIAELETKFKKETALNILVKILKDPTIIYTSSQENTIIPSIYSNVSLFLLRLNKYETSKEISKKGIDYSLRFSNLSGLAHLYYVNAISNEKLGNHVHAQINAIKCIMTSIVKKDKYEIDMFSNSFNDRFDEDPLTLIQKYKKHLKLQKDDKVL